MLSTKEKKRELTLVKETQPSVLEISVDQCGSSCGEDEDHGQTWTYSEVC